MSQCYKNKYNYLPDSKVENGVIDKLEHAPPREESSFTFYFEHALTFFSKRLQDKESPLIQKLKTWNSKIKKSRDPIDTYLEITKIIYNELISFGLSPKDISWDNLPDENLLQIWSYREIFLCLTFTTAYSISVKFTDPEIYLTPRKVYQEIVTGTILGSANLNSDIDVTVSAEHASSWIAVLEDLFESIGWFNHENWKIDLYGDFMLVGDYYIDTHYFTLDIIKELLHMSLLSYYRHPNSNLFDPDVLNRLLIWCSNKFNINIKNIKSKAILELQSIDQNDREQYYLELSIAEEMETQAIIEIEEHKYNTLEITKIFGEIMIQLAKANLYRSENYLIPSTTVQIVKIEQAKAIQSQTCDPILTKIANCSLSQFAYLLSAIEQLGYLQQKLIDYQDQCSLDANKYLGRFLRSLGTLGIVKHKTRYKQLLEITSELDAVKSERGKTGDLDKICPEEIDIYGLLKGIF